MDRQFVCPCLPRKNTYVGDCRYYCVFAAACAQRSAWISGFIEGRRELDSYSIIITNLHMISHEVRSVYFWFSSSWCV